MNNKGRLKGKKVLITAGPTREPLDAVRFLSNASTGKMGFALAREALRRKSRVILISGPTALSPPPGVQFIQVETALQMHKAVFSELAQTDIFIAAAAVADYRAGKIYSGKLKKKDRENLSFSLVLNPDILGEAGKKKERKILVGFALETKNPEKNAFRKLREKNLDLIVVNLPSSFASENIQAKIIDTEGKIENLPRMSKIELSKHILNKVEKLIT